MRQQTGHSCCSRPVRDGREGNDSVEDDIRMSNKKLVFRLCPDRPDYENVARASALIREGNLNVEPYLDSSIVSV